MLSNLPNLAIDTVPIGKDEKSNKLISNYNTIFITQIYDSNEYEGNVLIWGDSDFDPPEFTKTLYFTPSHLDHFDSNSLTFFD